MDCTLPVHPCPDVAAWVIIPWAGHSAYSGSCIHHSSKGVNRRVKKHSVTFRGRTCSQAPQASELQGLVGPVGQRMQEAQARADDRRSPAFNQAKLAAEALQALTWVVYTGPASGVCQGWHSDVQAHLVMTGKGSAPSLIAMTSEWLMFAGMNPPAQHVLDGWQAAEFWANKVLREHRATMPAQVCCLWSVLAFSSMPICSPIASPPPPRPEHLDTASAHKTD